MMTPRRYLLRYILSLAVLVSGAIITTAWTHEWNSKADKTTVDSLQQTNEMILQRLDALTVKVDSTNFRLTQIRCGSNVTLGCR